MPHLPPLLGGPSRPADEQVDRLLASLNINPLELPADELAQTPNFEQIFAAGAPRLAQPSAVGEHAAAAAMAAAAQQQQQQQHAAPQEAHWAQEFERLRLGEAGPSGSGSWAADFQRQQQQQGAPGAWADEFQAQAEAAPEADSAGWVNEFQSTAAAGAAMRQRAAEGDALEQTKRLADTLACEDGGVGAQALPCVMPADLCRTFAVPFCCGRTPCLPGIGMCFGTCWRVPRQPHPPLPRPCLPPPWPRSQLRPQGPGLQVPAVCVQDEPGRTDPGGQPGGPPNQRLAQAGAQSPMQRWLSLRAMAASWPAQPRPLSEQVGFLMRHRN